MINLHATGSSLTETPFTWPAGIDFLQLEGMLFTDADNADLIISGSLKQIMGLMLHYGRKKQYLLWSMEPRWCKHFESRVSSRMLPDFHVMNIYAGIFENNYLYVPNEPGELTFKPLTSFRNKKVVSLMTFQSGPFWIFDHNGTHLDLCNLRTEIALEGHRMGCIDIFGRGWPDRIAVGDSRVKGWENKKQEILGSYHFNLCFENTNWPFYCTEKIWQSVLGGCLPIYFGKGNSIYEDFPAGSFLDYCDYNDPQMLFDHIRNMEPEEYNSRMEMCIRTYNQAFNRKKELKPYHQILQKTVAKIRSIL